MPARMRTQRQFYRQKKCSTHGIEVSDLIVQKCLTRSRQWPEWRDDASTTQDARLPCSPRGSGGDLLVHSHARPYDIHKKSRSIWPMLAITERMKSAPVADEILRLATLIALLRQVECDLLGCYASFANHFAEALHFAFEMRAQAFRCNPVRRRHLGA